MSKNYPETSDSKTIISRTDEGDVLELKSHAELKMLAPGRGQIMGGTHLAECRNGAGQAVPLQNPGHAPGHGHRRQWGGGSTLKSTSETIILWRRKTVSTQVYYVGQV